MRVLPSLRNKELCEISSDKQFSPPKVSQRDLTRDTLDRKLDALTTDSAMDPQHNKKYWTEESRLVVPLETQK